MRAITLRQLRSLRALAETGGVTAAARSLKVTPPAVSMQIKLFEAQVGLPLVERVGERFVLTAAGHEALRAARAIDSTIEDLDATLATMRGGVAGNVSVGLVSTAKYFAPRMIGAFAREHPSLEHKLLQRTLAELDRTRRWMLLLGRKSAGEKLATFLLEMSERLVEPGCTQLPDSPSRRFSLPFSRQQVADVLGLTIETVSRQFTRLKADGLIDLPSRREVIILDREGLMAEAG